MRRIALFLPGQIHQRAWLIGAHVFDKFLNGLFYFVQRRRPHSIPTGLIEQHETLLQRSKCCFRIRMRPMLRDLADWSSAIVLMAAGWHVRARRIARRVESASART